MLVSEVMQRSVVTVRENATVTELAAVLADRGISGAPVVDREGRLLGVASRTDVVSACEHESRPRSYQDHWIEQAMHGYLLDAPEGKALVREIMSPVPCTLAETADVAEAARLMTERGFHRIVVTDSAGRVTGIVTAMDLVRLLPSVLRREAPHRG